MISSTRGGARSPRRIAGPKRSNCQKKLRVHLERAAGHDVVERGHAAEQRDVLEGAGDAAVGRVVRAASARASRP